ncbi:MAG: hypothetical protein EOP56_07260 [Sphingobacteriales bacterium]|nr:MAG: hypothetical protein EOP56_07260 [Sphingobacteriales bacterium]
MKECSDKYTFLYTVESKENRAALKFESLSNREQFTVTVLNEPELSPFVMRLEKDEWIITCDVCSKVRALEPTLVEAAAKFKR